MADQKGFLYEAAIHTKLKKRYPGGEFNVYESENRSADDR